MSQVADHLTEIITLAVENNLNGNDFTEEGKLDLGKILDKLLEMKVVSLEKYNTIKAALDEAYPEQKKEQC